MKWLRLILIPFAIGLFVCLAYAHRETCSVCHGKGVTSDPVVHGIQSNLEPVPAPLTPAALGRSFTFGRPRRRRSHRIDWRTLRRRGPLATNQSPIVYQENAIT